MFICCDSIYRGSCGNICDMYIIEDHLNRIVNYAEKLKTKLRDIKEQKHEPDEK